MSHEALGGGCLCGRVRYRAGGEASHVGYCHCRSCRRSSGAPFVAWATFPRSSFVFSAGSVGRHRSSARVERCFCPDCGTSLTYEHAATPAEIDVTLASLDDPAPLAPDCHIWVSQKLSWVELADGLPQYRETREAG